MANWTGGYAAQTGYTYGYFNEFNPLHVKLALLDAGIKAPNIRTACELGFGQGLSVNIHAAASDTAWAGTDFSPAQASFAQDLAEKSSNQAALHDLSFADFAKLENLPDFDFIGLHGIWAWVSDENRQIILEFINRKLKPGGVVYISYNTQAGWAQMAPIRHLLNQYASQVASPADSAEARLQQAFDFVENFLQTEPAFAKVNPRLSDLFQQIKHLNPTYLTHEYLGDSWQPQSFEQVAAQLAGIKLDFAGAASHLDTVDAINLSQAQHEQIYAQPDLVVSEMLRDLAVNQNFRREYWVKGAQKLDKFEQMEGLLGLPLVAIGLAEEFDFQVSGALGDFPLKRETYQPIVEFFADFQVKTIGQLAQAMSQHQIDLERILQAVRILVGKGYLQLAQTPEQIEAANEKCAKLNHQLLLKARGTDAIKHLASPVTGGGILTQGHEMLFMLALKFHQQSPEAIAQFAWGLLKDRGVKLELQPDLVAETDEQNLQVLTKQAAGFLGQPLKLYQALKVI